MDFTKFPLLCKLVDAVAKFEGGGPGRNNIGNIRCPGNNTTIWNHLSTGETGGFCNFPDRATGLYALREFYYHVCTSQSNTYNTLGHQHFNIKKSENLTLYQVIQIYAPKSDGNDPLHYATTIAGWIGVGIDFVMKNFVVATSVSVPKPTKPNNNPQNLPPPNNPPAPITSAQAQEITSNLSVATKILTWLKILFT